MVYVIYGLAAVPLVAITSIVLFLWGLGAVANHRGASEDEDEET